MVYLFLYRSNPFLLAKVDLNSFIEIAFTNWAVTIEISSNRQRQNKSTNRDHNSSKLPQRRYLQDFRILPRLQTG